jgi:hypothetical protein
MVLVRELSLQEMDRGGRYRKKQEKPGGIIIN